MKCVKFCTYDIRAMMLRKFKLRDHRCSKSHALLTSASDAAPIACIFCATCKAVDTTDTVSYHMWLGLGVVWKSVQLSPYFTYLLKGVNVPLYTLPTFIVRFGRNLVYEMCTKWLKFVIRDVYKMVEVRYTRCIRNGWNSLWKMYIKWLKFPVRDVYKMVEIRYTRCV